MRIIIELYDRTPQGKRLGRSRLMLSRVLATKTAGEGIRWDNLLPDIQRYFHAATTALLNKDTPDPEAAKAEKGTYLTILENLRKVFRIEGDPHDGQ